MIKIVIADDIAVIREGLKTILEQEEEIHVCGLAADGNEAYHLCQTYNPDLVLMDFQMPVCSGEQATKKIKESCPHIKVLVLTTFDDVKIVQAVLAAGADGYVLKGMDESKLVHAIKSTLAEINVLNRTVFQQLQSKYAPNSGALNIELTKREKEIISLIAKGNSNKEIAATLFLSDGTVRNHISAILTKLELKDRTQLAVYAVQNNL